MIRSRWSKLCWSGGGCGSRPVVQLKSRPATIACRSQFTASSRIRWIVVAEGSWQDVPSIVYRITEDPANKVCDMPWFRLTPGHRAETACVLLESCRRPSHSILCSRLTEARNAVQALGPDGRFSQGNETPEWFRALRQIFIGNLVDGTPTRV